MPHPHKKIDRRGEYERMLTADMRASTFDELIALHAALGLAKTPKSKRCTWEGASEVEESPERRE